MKKLTTEQWVAKARKKHRATSMTIQKSFMLMF